MHRGNHQKLQDHNLQSSTSSCSCPLESLNIKTKSSMGAFIGLWGSKVTYQSGEACTIISVYCFCCSIFCIWISMVTMVSTYLGNIVRSPARPTAQHHILSATFIVLYPLCWDLRYSTAQNKEQCAWGLRVWSSTLPCLDHLFLFLYRYLPNLLPKYLAIRIVFYELYLKII